VSRNVVTTIPAHPLRWCCASLPLDSSTEPPPAIMGYFYALLAALLFGANGSVSKVIIQAGFSAIELTQMRVLGAAVISGLILLALDRRSFRLPLRQWPVIIVLGVVGVAMLQATYAFAIALLPVGIALLLEYLAVLIVALFAYFFFKRRCTRVCGLPLALSLPGLLWWQKSGPAPSTPPASCGVWVRQYHSPPTS